MAIVEISSLKAKFEPGDSPKSSDFINLIDTLAALPVADVAANGIPSGGTTGQVLVKVDETNYNTQWSTTDLSGKQDVVANVSSTEIGYLDGVTSAIQTQINTKAPSADPTFTGTVSGVTKTHVGLGNVDNTTDAGKPVSTATQTALDLKANLSGPTFTGTVVLPSTTSIGDVSSTEVGYLNNVTSAIQTQLDDKSTASKTETLTNKTLTSPVIGIISNTGTLTLPTTTGTVALTSDITTAISNLVDGAPAALDTLNELAAAINDDASYASTITTALGNKAPIESPTFTGTVAGITKSMVGLSDVDNTTDANKPVSTAQQTALDLKANLSGPTLTGTTTINAIADASTTTAARGGGYMGIPQSAAATTGSYTVVSADAGEHIYSTATRTITIPANGTLALPVGTVITFIAGSGTTVTIAVTTDTMYLAGLGTTGSRTLAPFGMATAVKVASTTWFISGNGLS